MEKIIPEVAIVLGSSNSKGKTYQAIELFQKEYGKPTDFIDLLDYNISDFDYKHNNINDDFLPLIKKLLNYKIIILATPVYWYSMSATMKRFVDRLTDILHVKQGFLPLLQTKKIAIITSYGTYPDGKNGFEETFIRTCKYLDISYLGCYFYYSGEDRLGVSKNMVQLMEFMYILNK